MVAVSMMDTGRARLRPGDTLAEAMRTCAFAECVEIPVVDERGALCGVVRPASVLRAVFDGRGPAAPVQIGGMDAFALKEVRDVMTRDFVTIPPETLATEVARRLAGRGADTRCVFVVDDCARLLGVITTADMLKRLWKYAESSKKTP